jgi:predicted dehydrogenase
MQALDQGKHVFVEKPFVLQESQARAVRDALRKRPNLRLSSNLILRKSPRFVDLRRRIDAGELGRLYHLEGDYNYGRLHKILEGWRGQLEFYSAVHGGGVHVADLLMWLARDRVVEVSAVGNAIASAGSGFRNFDNVVAVLRFAGGAVGKLGVNFGCVFPHFHPLSLYGTQATFVNRTDHALLYTSREPQAAPVRLETAYPGTHKGDLLPSFVDAILGRGAAEVTERDVFDSLAVCFAIERSAHSGRPVAVEYLWEGS